MPGTQNGGRKAARTNKVKYDHLFADEPHGFYGKIGGIGGKISRGGGFAANRELAVAAGRKGGSAPRRPRNMDAYYAPRFVDDSEVQE
jgi:hypothetical protein